MVANAGAEVSVDADYESLVYLHKNGEMPKDAYIKVMGPFNTGTDYLTQLLNANDIPSHGDADTEGGWEYWPSQWKPADMTGAKRFNIVVARNPLSWVLKMKEHGENVECSYQEHGLKAPCTYSLPEGGYTNKNQRLRSALHGDVFARFDNILSVWNFYYRGYLADSVPTLVVRYEDLLHDPQAVVSEIGEATGHIIKNMTKDGRRVSSFKSVPAPQGENMQWNVGKQFMSQFTETEREWMRTQLDAQCMNQFGYSLPPMH